MDWLTRPLAYQVWWLWSLFKDVEIVRNNDVLKR